VIITNIFLSVSAESQKHLRAKKPALYLPNVSHFQNLFLMCRTEEEKEKETGKTKSPLLPFQTWRSQPSFGAADATWGFRQYLHQLHQSTFPISSATYPFRFLLISPQQGPSDSRYYLVHHQQKGVQPARALWSAWCVRQGERVNRNDCLNVRVWKWRRKKVLVTF